MSDVLVRPVDDSGSVVEYIELDSQLWGEFESDSEVLCEHLPPCGRSAELLLVMMCDCHRYACLPCRDYRAGIGFLHQECRTCGAELDGAWGEIIIRELPI